MKVILIGTGEDPEEDLGVRLDLQKEDENTAEIFNNLRMEISKHHTAPLFKSGGS